MLVAWPINFLLVLLRSQMYQYHGPDRSRKAVFLASHDVVLTTYSVLGGDLVDGKGLLAVKWLRVVLDEVRAVWREQNREACCS